MERKIVHIVGTGTIGEPLIGLLCDYRDQLGIDGITFHKNTALVGDRSKVLDLMERGARLAVDEEKIHDFKKLNMDPDFETEEAIKRAMVVIDCTPRGIGHVNKNLYYEKFAGDVKGFLAQGSEDGFGKKYARGINDQALDANDQFIQIVSCNTHNVSCITDALAVKNDPDNLVEGKYVCIRRANDISQETGFIPSPQVGTHTDEKYGSHHAKDSAALFHTLGMDLNLFSSAMKVNSQYMHILHFHLKVKKATNIQKIIARFDANDLIATTDKVNANEVFSFGRDHGHFGRILNQTVVSIPSLSVRHGTEITGFCFTPQDGNSLLSSIAITEWFLYPHSYESKIQCLSPFFFNEV